MQLYQKIIFIRAKLNQLANDLAAEACLARQDHKSTAMEKSLFFYKDELVKLIGHLDNSKICTSSCKFTYFCDLEKGHEGAHSDAGFLWEDICCDRKAEADYKVRSRVKKKTARR